MKNGPSRERAPGRLPPLLPPKEFLAAIGELDECILEAIPLIKGFRAPRGGFPKEIEEIVTHLREVLAMAQAVNVQNPTQSYKNGFAIVDIKERTEKLREAITNFNTMQKSLNYENL